MFSLYLHRCALEEDLITDVFKNHWRLVWYIICNGFKLDFKNSIKGVLKHEFSKKEIQMKGSCLSRFLSLQTNLMQFKAV